MAFNAFPIPTSGIDALPTTGALFVDHEVWAKRAGVDVRVPMSQILALFQTNGIATVGASSAVNFTVTGLFKVGTTAAQSNAPAAILTNIGNGLEFGHVNGLFRAMLGADQGGGTPFIGFELEAGTTVNTYRTRGTRGTIIKPDNAGGIRIQNVALATGDNQAAVDLFAINNAGGITTPLTTTAAFTSIGIDDNATSERMEIQDGSILIGTSVSAGGVNLCRYINDGYMAIAGGTAGAGANLLLIGGTHTSLAFDYGFARGATNVYYYDDSANTHSFYSSAGGSAVNIFNPTTNVFFPDCRFGQNLSSAPGVGNAAAGVCLTTGISYFSAVAQAMAINNTSNGNMVGFYLAGANQGFISGSGTTITYGAFMGSHIGQQSLADLAADLELLRGSIVQTTDEMSEWIGFEFTDHDGNQVFNEDITKAPKKSKVGDVFDYTYERTVPDTVTHVEEVDQIETEEVDEPFTDYDVIDGKATAVERKRKKRMPIFDEFPVIDKNGKPVMDLVGLLDNEGMPIFDPVLTKAGKQKFQTVNGEKIPVTQERLEEKQRIIRVPRRVMVPQERIEHIQKVVFETVPATVVSMPNDTLVKWKLTTEAGCERPYGVIAWKDHDGSEDWLISGLGAYVCRIKKGVTVKGGDLIQSSDVVGCGEPITDEMNLTTLQIVKRHVATVGANLPQPIYFGGPLFYPDGSYIVPATIHCG